MLNFGTGVNLNTISADLFRSNSLYRHAINRAVNSTFGPLSNMISVQIGEDNKPYYRIVKGDRVYTANSIRRANSILAEPLSSVKVFSGRQRGTGPLQFSMGGYRNERLESMAEAMGGIIEQETYSLSGKQSHKYILDSIKYSSDDPGSALGIPVFDDDNVHILRFKRKVNGKYEYATVNQFFETARNSLGLRTGSDLSSLFKRLKTLTSPRAADMFLYGDELSTAPRVGFFTLDQFHAAAYGKSSSVLTELERQLQGRESRFSEAGDLKGAIDKSLSRSLDGQMIINSDYLNRYIKPLEDRIAAYREQARHVTDPSELSKIEREIKAYERNIQKIRHIQRTGGSSNERFITDVFGKGDAVFHSSKSYKDFLLRMGMAERGVNGDIVGKGGSALPDIVMLQGQGKSEIALDKVFLGTSEFRNKAQQLEVGITESATFPSIFNEEFLGNSFEQETRNIIREFKEGRSSTGSLARMADEVMQTPEPEFFSSIAEAEEFQQMRKYARKVQSSLKYGVAPGEIDTFGIQFISMYRDHFLKFRKQGRFTSGSEPLPDLAFRTRVKGGSMAEISDTAVLFSPRKKQTPYELMQGTIRYDGFSGRFGLTTSDFASAYKAAGGFDADDTYRAILQYDSATKRAVAFMTRQPFEMGEYMYFDADMSSMPLFGFEKDVRKELRRASLRRSRILRELSEKSESLAKYMTGSGPESELAKAAVYQYQQDLTAANETIDRILSSEAHQVNLASKYGLDQEFMAPKGFRVSQESLAEYQRSNILRDFRSVTDMSETDFIKSFITDLGRSRSSTGLPFEFMGDNYNLVDSRYYRLIDDDAQLRALAEKSGLTGKADVARIKNLIAAAEAESGRVMSQAELAAFVNDSSKRVLGNWVNFKTTVDNLIETQLRGKNAPWAVIDAIDREKIIDAAVKTRDFDILAAADAMARTGAETLARWLADQRKADPENAVRLSRYMYDTRMGAYSGILERVAKESGISIDDILTSEDQMSRAVAKRIGEVQGLDRLLTETMDEISLMSEDSLRRFAPSAKEFEIAKEFVDDYLINAAEVAEAKRDPLSLARKIVQSPESYAGEFIGEEELNRRSLAFLESRGILNSNNPAVLERQILSIAKYIQQNKGYLERLLPNGIASPLMTYSSLDSVGLSMGDLTLSTFERYNLPGGMETLYSLRDELQDQFLSGDDIPDIDFRLTEVEERISALEARSTSVLVNQSEGLKTGIFRRVEREIADTTSSRLTQVTLKRFNKQDFMALVNAPETRKFMKGSMIAAGAFLALGALHGEKAIERTPEQIGGPPLLPGGSAYEDYSDVDDFSSMYSVAPGGNMSPGMLYRVNVSGRVEPNDLQRRIMSITGGGSFSSTIYQSRITTDTGRSNSMSYLNDRLGL